jgi:uncharacterized protein (TIGR02118 family)
MAVLKVCYKQGVRFDEAYYVSKHLPVVRSVMGPHGVASIEVVKLNAAVNGSKPPYQVMFTAHFASESGLRSALQSPQMPQVLSDIQNFYDGTPDVLIGDVLIAEVASLPA